MDVIFPELLACVTFGFASESAPGEFNWATTAEQALDKTNLSEKVVVVTGANAGIGKETARVLSQAKATVIMACRSMARGEEARKEIIALSDQHDISDRLKLMHLDLGDLSSVRQFARDFEALDLPCHFLIENAGLGVGNEYQETTQGVESRFGVNHLAHYYLGRLMLPTLQRETPSRLITLSSGAHLGAPDLDEWTRNHCGEHPHGPTREEYGAGSSYGVSKMGTLLFAQEFNRRYRDTGVTAVSVHPGIIRTELTRHLGGWQEWIYYGLLGSFMKSVEQGAGTTVRCVSLSDDEIVPGAYYVNCQPETPREDAVLRTDIPVEQTPQFMWWTMSEQVLNDLDFEI